MTMGCQNVVDVNDTELSGYDRLSGRAAVRLAVSHVPPLMDRSWGSQDCEMAGG